jgi:hypothetical protein
MADTPEWRVAGDWFDLCKCKVPCPCTFAQEPTYGDCEGVLVWHIREGKYGDVGLDGLNVAVLGSFEGNIWSGRASNLRFGLFLDERADERQRDALQMIFSGQAGGYMAEMSAIWGEPEVAGLEFASVRVEIAEDLGHWQVEVPGKINARAEALTGPTTPAGERVQTLNPPGSETGGRVATWGVATEDRADGFGWGWERQGNSSKHIPFDWSGPGT